MDMSQHPSNKQIIVMDRNLNTVNNKLSGSLCRTQSCGIQTDFCLFQSAASVDALKLGGTPSAQMTSDAAGASQIAKQVSDWQMEDTCVFSAHEPSDQRRIHCACSNTTGSFLELFS